MAIAVGDVLQANWVGSCFGQRIMMTHHYAVTTTDLGVPELDAQTALGIELTGGGGGDLVETVYRACLPPDYSLSYVGVQRVSGVRTREVKVTRSQAGTNANTAYQANVHAGLTFTTNLAGRKQVATKKIGPIAQHISLYDDGVITPTLSALLAALAAAMKTVASTVAPNIDFTPVIYHRVGTPNYDFITGSIIQDTIRVKTRRTVRVGI